MRKLLVLGVIMLGACGEVDGLGDADVAALDGSAEPDASDALFDAGPGDARFGDASLIDANQVGVPDATTDTPCDILTQNCPDGLGCYWVNAPPPNPSRCLPVGTIPPGADCPSTGDTFNDCVPGAICAYTDHQECLVVCRYPSGTPSCSGGDVCYEATGYGFGVCV